MFLFPSLLRDRVTDITPADLASIGVRGLLLDVDNTLTAHHSRELAPAVKDWLAAMKAARIGLTVVSNGRKWRVKAFTEKTGMQYISMAAKPSPLGFIRGARRLNLPLRECAAVGDQTFTDIIGAKLCGMKAIQVLPVNTDASGVLWVKRKIEGKILKRYKMRNEE